MFARHELFAARSDQGAHPSPHALVMANHHARSALIAAMQTPASRAADKETEPPTNSTVPLTLAKNPNYRRLPPPLPLLSTGDYVSGLVPRPASPFVYNHQQQQQLQLYAPVVSPVNMSVIEPVTAAPSPSSVTPTTGKHPRSPHLSGEKEESFKKAKILLVNSGTNVDDLCFRCKIVGCKGSHSCMFDSNVFYAKQYASPVVPARASPGMQHASVPLFSPHRCVRVCTGRARARTARRRCAHTSTSSR